jgi:bifunctional DNA-binding transcriptional regulator/antitoxin component of YhaV-PrlF toxin-antitoxin module
MSVKGKYVAPLKIFAVSRVFQHGKTQIPKEVRRALHLEDGDRVLWYNEGGVIFLKRLE